MPVSGIKTSPRVDVIKLALPGERIDLISRILSELGDNGINIWFVVQVRTHDNILQVTLCVDPAEAEKATAIIRELHSDIELAARIPGTILSVFPYRDNPEIALRFLQALERINVPILAVSTSLSSLACLIPHEQHLVVREALEKAFGLRG